MKPKSFLIFFLSLCAISLLTKAQTPFAGLAGSFNQMLDSIRKEKADSIRFRLNQEFFDTLELALLQSHKSFAFTDSLHLASIVSDDMKIRVITWNIQQNNGENIYTGFVINQLTGKISPLSTHKSDPQLDQLKIYRNGGWPSAIYYRLIQRKFKSSVSYTLLGWDGLNRRVSRKMADILSFDENGQPVFGGPMFKTKEGIQNRIVMEYSANASFTLQYNRQKVMLTGVRKSMRNIDDEMIIMDRLAPMNPELEGQRWAYVPVGNIYDGYIFFNGIWTFTEDISPRNPSKSKPGSQKSKKPELELFQKKD